MGEARHLSTDEFKQRKRDREIEREREKWVVGPCAQTQNKVVSERREGRSTYDPFLGTMAFLPTSLQRCIPHSRYRQQHHTFARSTWSQVRGNSVLRRILSSEDPEYAPSQNHRSSREGEERGGREYGQSPCDKKKKKKKSSCYNGNRHWTLSPQFQWHQVYLQITVLIHQNVAWFLYGWNGMDEPWVRNFLSLFKNERNWIRSCLCIPYKITMDDARRV